MREECVMCRENRMQKLHLPLAEKQSLKPGREDAFYFALVMFGFILGAIFHWAWVERI